MKQAVLFDLDGTLLDTLADLADAVNAALAALGFPIHPVEAYRYFVGDGVETLMRRTLPPEAAADEAILKRAMELQRTEYAQRWHEKTRPYPGVLELLCELERKAIRMAILSNKPDPAVITMVSYYFPASPFEIARGAGVKTAISLSDPNMVTYFKAGLLEMIGGGVDLLFANEAEAKGMAGNSDLDGALDYLKTIAREFAITRGPKGALVWDGSRMIEIDAVRVQAVDTVGAGDMFAGAFLYGLTQGWGHERAGALASAAAGKLVTSLGPRISAAETQEILRRFV